MTSRERIAINHKEADRVPVDWCMLQSIQILAWPCDYILDMFGVDTRYITANPSSSWKLEHNENGKWVNEFG